MAEEQIAWTAVKTGEAVVTSDGTNIGKVVEVAALANEDIFHGIVFEHAHRRKHYLAPAADIDRITTEAVHLSVDAQVRRVRGVRAAPCLPPRPQRVVPLEAFRLEGLERVGAVSDASRGTEPGAATMAPMLQTSPGARR